MNKTLVEKKEEDELPIPAIWRPTFKVIVNAFVMQDYKISAGIKNVNPVSKNTAEQIKRVH